MASIREQLKHDRTQEVATEAVHWTQAHRTAILAAVGGAVVVAAIIIGVYAYLQKQNQAASVALGQAMHKLNSPVRPAGAPADPNQPSYASVEERDKAAVGAFEGVAAKYPRTDAGFYSLYMAGVVQLDQGDSTGAEKSFQRAISEGNSNVSSLAKLALANLYVSQKREPDAIKLYKELIEHPTNTVPKATSELELAQLYEDKNQKTDAVKLYEQMQKDNQKNGIGQLAQQKIEQLKGSAK